MNILLVSIAYPPKRDPESLQTGRYLAALAKLDGARVDVITSAPPTLAMPTDDGLFRYWKAHRQLVEVSYFESRYTNYALEKLWPAALRRPDSRRRFSKQWKMAARALRSRPDVVYSRSFPLSSTLMAYHLARHYGVPWVLHLSDPWTLSPLHSTAGAAAWNEEAEAMCFEAATAITFTTQGTVDLYARKYPGHVAKFKVFPNVYEADQVRPNPWSRGPRLRLVYTGSLVGTRSPGPVIAALTRLEAERPEVHRDIEVIFAGTCDRENAALLARGTKGLQYLGSIPIHEAVALQRSADALLLIDSALGSRDSAVFFPSKLLDYVAAGRRTIGVTDRDSASWQVMGELGLGDRITHEDVDGLSCAIVDAWTAWRAGDHAYFERHARSPRLEAGFNAQRLMDLFRSVSTSASRADACSEAQGPTRFMQGALPRTSPPASRLPGRQTDA